MGRPVFALMRPNQFSFLATGLIDLRFHSGAKRGRGNRARKISGKHLPSASGGNTAYAIIGNLLNLANRNAASTASLSGDCREPGIKHFHLSCLHLYSHMRQRRRHRRLLGELLEDRRLLAVYNQHSATVTEYHNVGYFLSSFPSRIERYDIANQAWLTPVSLPIATPAPTAELVDETGIFVAYGAAVYRYNLDGTGQTHLLNANNNVQAIHSDGNLLFINHSSGLYARFVSINKTTGAIIDSFENYVDSVYGSSISTETNRILGRNSGISPSDITFMSYTDTGDMTTGGGSPYHGDYPGGSLTWVFPGGAKVVDNSGTIYAADSLTRLNSFGSGVTDLDFVGTDVPILLSGKTLTAYNSAILPTGSKTLTYSPTTLFVNATNIITFTPDVASNTGLRADITKLSDLNPAMPGQPINPLGLAYTPDKIELAADGTVLLFSKAHQSIFRWNPATQTYGATIPLVGAANHMAYAAPTNTLYLAYQSGLIRKIDLNDPTLSELPFATLAYPAGALSTAGQFVFATDNMHRTFAPNGSLVDSADWHYWSSSYFWSETNQKMYFIRESVSPTDILWGEINANGTRYPGEPAGGVRNTLDSPLHSSEGFSNPVRVSPDGSLVVLGSGKLHDATTLARLTFALANPIKDAAWLGTELFTLKASTTTNTELQHWSKPTFALDNTKTVGGTPFALKTVAADKLLVVSLGTQGIPLFTLFNPNMEVIPGERQLVLSLTGNSVVENLASGAVVGTFSVLDSAPGHTFTYALVAGAGDGGNASFAITGNALRTAKSLDFEAQGSYSVRIKATDDTGASVEQTFTIHVTNANEAPVAQPDSFATDEDTPLVVSVAETHLLSNDSDFEGNALTASLVRPPAHGSVTVQADGSFRYVPEASYSGPDNFTYRASDGTLTSSAVTVSLDVRPANDAPDARPDAYVVLFESARTIGGPGVLGNDLDAEGSALTASVVAQPEHGTLTLNSDGSFVYVPAAGFSGTDRFTYRASDGSLSDTAEVTLHVLAPNSPPVAQNDSLSGTEDQPQEILLSDLLANDSDADGNSLQALLHLGSGPAHGRLSLISNRLLYEPEADFFGVDTFVYRADDGQAVSGLATVTLNIQPVNDAPSFQRGADVRANDDDGPVAINQWATGIFAGPSNESNQTLDFLVLTTNPQLFSVAPDVDASGKLTFTPAPNVSGSATVMLVLVDSGGTERGGDENSEPQVFQITIDKPHPLHNAGNPLDTTGDGFVAPGDALAVINHINAGITSVPASLLQGEGESFSREMVDVNGDNFISPSDALDIINHINSRPRHTGGGSGEALVPEGEAELMALLATDLVNQALRKRP